MMKKLLKQHPIHSLAAPKEALREMWQRFECEMITRLVKTFNERLQACLNVGGESIPPLISAHRLVVYGPPLGHLMRPPIDEEDATVLTEQQKLGNKWKKIPDIVGDRTSTWVRSRFRYLVNKERLEAMRASGTPDEDVTNVISTFPEILRAIDEGWAGSSDDDDWKGASTASSDSDWEFLWEDEYD
jgi:hypothetical protein